MTRNKIFLSMCIILCFIFVGCVNEVASVPAPELIRSPAARIDTAVIQRGDLIGVYRRTGITRYISEPLYFLRPVSAFGEFHVAPGDFVTEGQLLITLDTERLDEQIEEHVQNIANMRRDNALTNNIRQLDIDIMVLEHAQRVNQAAENFDQEAAENIEAQSLSIERARLELRQQQERQAVQLNQAEIRLEGLRQRRASAELHAPFSGHITNVVNISQGQSVGVAQPLLFITDGSQTVIEAINTPHSDWPQPGPGGMPPDPWRPNTVRRATKMQAHISGQVFDIEYLTVPLDERELRPVRFNAQTDTPLAAGEYVELYLYTQFIPDVLLVPENALYFSGAQPYVYRVVNGEMIYTEIRLQGRTLLMAAVSEGLEEGDIVFIRP
jgi:multidrug efflux pump subunit AcrA (membrane-fusion protein)